MRLERFYSFSSFGFDAGANVFASTGSGALALSEPATATNVYLSCKKGSDRYAAFSSSWMAGYFAPVFLLVGIQSMTIVIL